MCISHLFHAFYKPRPSYPESHILGKLKCYPELNKVNNIELGECRYLVVHFLKCTRVIKVLEFTYLPDAFFAIFHTSLVLMFIYFRSRTILAKVVLVQIPRCVVGNFFSLHVVKYSFYGKMCQTKFSNIEGIGATKNAYKILVGKP
jgi:hypothetical protein